LGEQTKALILLLILISLAVSITEVKVAKTDSRTLVVPDDYPTIASAVGNATDGDTIFVKKGTYDGPINQTLVIKKTISLIGEDPENTLLNMYPAYIVKQDVMNFPFREHDYSIKILADDVELSGFTIDSNGVYENGFFTTTGLLTTGNNVRIIDNVLNLNVWLKGSHEYFANNTLRIGIVCSGGVGTLTKNNIVGTVYIGSQTSSYTIYDNILTNDSGIIVGGRLTRIFNNTVNNCSLGVRVSSYSSDNFVYENVLTNNAIGLSMETTGGNNTFYGNYVANNEIGVINGVEEITRKDPNTIYNNNFVNNVKQVKINGDFEDDQWDNGAEGNYWSDYNGTDSDGDGIGDNPYIIDENNRDNYPLIELHEIPWFQPPDTIAPTLIIDSPQNETYNTDSVTLQFTVDEETSWMGYSLDGQNTVTTTENTITLSGLSNGVHNMTVYANDTAGNTGTSETFTFTMAKEIETEPEPNPTSWTVIATAVVAVAIVGTALTLIYTKTRKNRTYLKPNSSSLLKNSFFLKFQAKTKTVPLTPSNIKAHC
jgi:parallel beta-helix repeat protein